MKGRNKMSPDSGGCAMTAHPRQLVFILPEKVSASSDTADVSPDMAARHHDAKNNARGGILSLLLSAIMLVKPSLVSAQASQPQGPVKEPQKVEALQKDTAQLSESPYLQAVRTFADNVLKHGRDTYGPKHTPLFVDGLNVNTYEPVKWISPKGDLSTTTETEKWILSNFASQQTLLRTLDGLSKITGDPKYRDAAKQAIKYAFENLRDSNGLFYWGHYVAYDAQADNVRFPSSKSHILKVHYPYYELMWQVDPEATKRFIEAFWSVHVLDWSNLDFNRIGRYSAFIEEPWNHEYKDRPTFFKSKGGLGFLNTGTSLAYAGTMLYRLSGEEQPLVWSKRLIQRFVDTRHPKTGMAKYLYNRQGGSPLGDNLSDHFTDQRSFIFPSYPFPELRNIYYPENVQAHQWMSLLLMGDMIGEQGREFSRWAVEELTAWGKASYRKEDNSFVPIITDGTNIEGYVLKETCGRGEKGSIAKPLFVDLRFFWAYATAYRITGDEFMWQMVRDIGTGNKFGDIGEVAGQKPELKMDTACTDVYSLLGFLELYNKTKKQEFLLMARRLADNIVVNQFHGGFFVLSKKHIYTRFDCFEPLALLHLVAILESHSGSVPRVWSSSPLFVPPYRYKREGVDRRIIYTLTESPEVPWSLQEAAHIGNINQVKVLLESGTNVDSVDNSFRMTALQRAAISGRREIVELLIAKGAKVNAKNEEGKTPLDIAVDRGYTEIAELLRKPR